MHKEELLPLRLEQIDLRRREVHLDITKTSSPRRAPLSVTAKDTIRDLLERRGRPATPFLFCKTDGTRIGDPKKGFHAACVRAGLTTSANTISVIPSRHGGSRAAATYTGSAASSGYSDKLLVCGIRLSHDGEHLLFPPGSGAEPPRSFKATT